MWTTTVKAFSTRRPFHAAARQVQEAQRGCERGGGTPWARSATHVYETMAAKSTLAVRGVATRALRTWNLKEDEYASTHIIMPGTDYEIAGGQYFKGSGPSTLTVTLVGGTYQGKNEVEEVEVGKEYLFFIKPYAGRSQLTPDGEQRHEVASIFGLMEVRDGMVLRGGAPSVEQLPLDEVSKRVK